MIDLSKIKVVIWDLDDTFWNGTLSEGSIIPIEANISLIKRLTDCGIVNSICSKNEENAVIEKLSELGVLSCFVFLSINWEPKGIRVTNQLKRMGLRSENCLFIDDNIHNIEDVKYACPNIMSAMPSELNNLIEQVNNTIPKDLKHSRLEQYKVLEKKQEAADKYGDNLEFLYSSNIRVDIHEDCQNRIDRITELVARTNQLNFTKRRDTKDEIQRLIDDQSCNTGYVTVKDNFGDYGIVGFFAVKDNKLIHFLFSCRTIGQGIEDYVYAKLNYPELNIVQPVINQLKEREAPKWINQNIKIDSHNKRCNSKKVVFKGACDLSQMCEYLSSKSIIEEFSYISNEKKIFIEHHNHSVNYLGWRCLSQQEKDACVENLVFNDSEMFETSMFDDDVEMVMLSTMIEPHMGVYRNRKTGFRIAFGEANHPLTKKSEWDLYVKKILPQGSSFFTNEWLEKFSNEYEFYGALTIDEIISNVEETLRVLRPEVKVCYVLGPEMRYEKETNPTYFGREKIYKELNNRLRELSKVNPRVLLIDVNEYIHSQSDFTNNINHWQRMIYYKMAERANEYLSELSTIEVKKKGYAYFIKRKIAYRLARTGIFETKLWHKFSKIRRH